jgi:hypothetical protein
MGASRPFYRKSLAAIRVVPFHEERKSEEPLSAKRKPVTGRNAPSRARQALCKDDILFSTGRTYLRKIVAAECDYPKLPHMKPEMAFINFGRAWGVRFCEEIAAVTLGIRSWTKFRNSTGREMLLADGRAGNGLAADG